MICTCDPSASKRPGGGALADAAARTRPPVPAADDRVCAHNIPQRHCSKCGGHRLGSAAEAAAAQASAEPASRATASRQIESGPPKVVSMLGLTALRKTHSQSRNHQCSSTGKEDGMTHPLPDLVPSREPGASLPPSALHERAALQRVADQAQASPGDVYLEAVRNVAQVFVLCDSCS